MKLKEIPNNLYNHFFQFVYPDPNTGCWLWGGGKYKTGYGSYNLPVEFRGDGIKNIWRAHRFSWLLHGNELLDGLDLCHSCDNRLCVSPDHLWLGTRQQNMLDMKAKKRNPRWDTTYCQNGHLRTKENTMPKSNGFKECRECRRLRWHKIKGPINAARRVGSRRSALPIGKKND